MTAADQQILAGVGSTARVAFRDQHGETVTPAPGATVTVEVTSAWAQFAPVTASASADPTGWTAPLPAVPRPDLLTLTWTDNSGTVVSSTVEIVGGYYGTISEIRGDDRSMIDQTMGDPVKFPTGRLVAARRFVEEEFETVCGRAFVPRYAAVTVTADGHVALPHPDVRAIHRVTVDGVEIPAPTPASTGTTIISGVTGPVSVLYEHGTDRPPQAIVRAFFTRVRHAVNALSSAVPDRASTFSSENGATYSLLTEGRAGSITAIPSVDAALRAHAYRPGLIG